MMSEAVSTEAAEIMAMAMPAITPERSDRVRHAIQKPAAVKSAIAVKVVTVERPKNVSGGTNQSRAVRVTIVSALSAPHHLIAREMLTMSDGNSGCRCIPYIWRCTEIYGDAP